MKSAHFLLFAGGLVLILGLSLAGAAPSVAQGPTPTPEPPPPPITDPLGQPPSFLVNYYEAWVNSPHADTEAEAFVHWNTEGAIPANCATCHSTNGYLDYLGADGSDAGTTDKVAPIGGVVNCNACHAPEAASLTTVTFPSGVEVQGMGDSTRCMICHQGRASTVQVNAAIERAGLTDKPNEISADLRFVNIHYYAAAATIYGTEAKGGYEYPGKAYQVRYNHVPGFNTCAGCHDPHTLEVKVEACATCHEDVEEVEDLHDVRMQGSLVDYDGDGSIREGIKGEIEGLQEMLLQAIQAYATNITKTPIVYNPSAYPYFLLDANGNGTADADETAGYNAYTPKLLQAAYNLQVSYKDPGGYAHNASYHIELLFDSIESLNAELGDAAIPLGQANRNDSGHFDTTAEAWRHWDEDGMVPGSCAKCHTAEGLPTFLANNTNIAVAPSASMACTTCHDAIPEFTVYEVAEVTFPSGAKVSFGERDVNNLCLNCHQGRESTVSVNRTITNAKVGDDEVSESLTFRNIHYFAAGASLFGTEVKGAYEFEGKEYNGRFMHAEEMQSCTSCHDQHATTVRFGQCSTCHEGATGPREIRVADGAVDYDGDGNLAEPIYEEMVTLKEDLLARIYAYAKDKAGTAIVYASAAHPYWFKDTNGNGIADADEINGDNRYNQWTPNLLRAAYNYQFVSKDPGGYVHNAEYLIQVLYDSIERIGGAEAVAKYTRPAVIAPAN